MMSSLGDVSGRHMSTENGEFTHVRTRRMASFLSLLAIAMSCASRLNLTVEIGVVKFAMDLRSFGFLVSSVSASEP